MCVCIYISLQVLVHCSAKRRIFSWKNWVSHLIFFPSAISYLKRANTLPYPQMSKAKEAFVSILLDHMIIFFMVLIYLERELEFLIYSILIFYHPTSKRIPLLSVILCLKNNKMSAMSPLSKWQQIILLSFLLS